MNAPIKRPKAEFDWADPLLLEEQLTQEERMVRDAAHAYAQGKLAPRVLDAFRNETTDPEIFRERDTAPGGKCDVHDGECWLPPRSPL